MSNRDEIEAIDSNGDSVDLSYMLPDLTPAGLARTTKLVEELRDVLIKFQQGTLTSEAPLGNDEAAQATCFFMTYVITNSVVGHDLETARAICIQTTNTAINMMLSSLEAMRQVGMIKDTMPEAPGPETLQ